MGDFLAGVRILDCSRLMPFGYATHLLLEAGAEVIKLEAPGGEYGREMRETFELTSRGKRSLTLDLRHPDAREVFLRLVGMVDVVFESFRPGYMARLGLDYENVKASNPAIVYCSATGYGLTGTLCERPGHDPNYAGLAGLLRPSAEEPPRLQHIPYIDMVSGWAAAYAIAIGVFRASATGVGQHLDVAMADVALSLNTIGVAYAASSGGGGAGAGGTLAGLPWPDLLLERCPALGTFRTSDRRYLVFANVEPKFWSEFLRAVERPDLEPHRFATGEVGDRVRRELEEIIVRRSLAQWEELLEGYDVCVAPANTPADALRTQHFLKRGVLEELSGGSWHLHMPVVADGQRRHHVGEVPVAGEANEELLGQLGYGPEQVEAWRIAGII